MNATQRYEEFHERKRLEAAATRGDTGWGFTGGFPGQGFYAAPAPPRTRRRCSCGCGQRQTHLGMSNGVTLTGGCELSMRRWVRERTAAPRAVLPAGPVVPLTGPLAPNPSSVSQEGDA